jgi:DNA-binding NtrC family response regulator
MRLSRRVRKPIILCIEDNRGCLHLRRAVLKKNGYSVLGATTSAQALKMLLGSPVSLVISDHMLGETVDTDLAKEMKRLKPLVPILLYAGATPDHLGDADCFLSKTEPVETFLTMVASLVHRYLV